MSPCHFWTIPALACSLDSLFAKPLWKAILLPLAMKKVSLTWKGCSLWIIVSNSHHCAMGQKWWWHPLSKSVYITWFPKKLFLFQGGVIKSHFNIYIDLKWASFVKFPSSYFWNRLIHLLDFGAFHTTHSIQLQFKCLMEKWYKSILHLPWHFQDLPHTKIKSSHLVTKWNLSTLTKKTHIWKVEIWGEEINIKCTLVVSGPHLSH